MLETVINSIIVTLLGTGTPGPRIDRFGPSTLVEAGGLRLLFDCGRGTMQRIYQIDTDTSSFDKLFLTHLHSDHTTGIPDLWITRYIFIRLDTAKENTLRIWGPNGTKQMLEHLAKAFEVDKKVRNELWGIPQDEGIRIEAYDIDEGFIFEENGVKVVPFRVNHHDLYSDEPSLGYRIEYNDRSVVLSGDTRLCENLIRFSENVDLLVHEVAAGPLGVSLPDSMKIPLAHHTLPEECGVVFSQVKPKLAVYHHIVQFQGVSLEEMMARTRKEYDGPVLFGEDLMRIEVGDSVKVLSSETR